MRELLADPTVQLVAGLLLVTILLDMLVRRMLRRALAETISNDGGAEAESPALRRREWFVALSSPLTLLVWYYGIYGVARVLVTYLPAAEREWLAGWLGRLAGAGAFVGLIWMLQRVTGVVAAGLRRKARASPGGVDDVLLPLLGSGLRVLPPLVALFFLVRLWQFPPAVLVLLNKLIAAALIGAMAWLVRRAVELTEQAVFVRKELRAQGNFAGRALVTRVSVLRKIATVAIGGFALAATLMLFDEVRDVGRSILASAGIAGVILGFAAQRTLGNLFAGLQIALTQPIRLGDQIGVEGDVGIVEEITLTYVVIRIWDQRRKIVPISFLIENSVINHTRTSSAQTGAVLLRADFTLPVPEFRAHLETLVRASRFWDRKTFAVQVVDAHHESMELRIIAGAATPGDAFNLQCELREAAIDFIHLRYPQCLPKAREEGKPIKGWRESEEFGARDPAVARTAASAPAAAS